MTDAIENLMDEDSDQHPQPRIPLCFEQNKLLIYFALFFYTALVVQEARTARYTDLLGVTPGHLLVYALVLIPYVYLFTRPGLFRDIAVPDIRLSDNSMILPRSVPGGRVENVPYSDITGLEIRGSGPNSFLVLETRKFTTQYPRVLFQNPEDLGRLARHINEHLAAVEPVAYAAMQQRRVEANRHFHTIPYCTIVLALALIAGYIWQFIVTGGAMYRLPGIGANSSVLVFQGEWFRLFSSSFLHSGLFHLLLNLAGLAALGFIIEGMLGWARFAAVYTASLLIGSMFSAAHGNLLSVGASAPLFGLLGSYAYLHIIARNRLPIGFVMRKRWWIGIFLLNILLTILVPRIDIAAHAGGFLTGFIVTAVLTLHGIGRPDVALRRQSFFANSIGALCLLTFVVALGEMSDQVRNAETRTDKNIAVMSAMVNTPNIRPAELNAFAWDIAIDPRASNRMMELAHSAALTALQAGKQPEIADTYATILYRMGRFDTAVAIEARLAFESKSPEAREVYASQLVRFLNARRQHTGHRDSNHILARKAAFTPEELEAALQITPARSRILVFLGSTATGEKKVLFLKHSRRTSTSSIASLGQFASLSFVGTLAPRKLSQQLAIVSYSSAILELAVYNPDEFAIAPDISRYEKRLIPGEQLLL